MNFIRCLVIAASVLLPVALTACSGKPPGCAAEETLSTTKKLVLDDVPQLLEQEMADDPDGLVRKFLDGMKIEITGIVNEGFNDQRRRQACRGTMRLTMIDGQVRERMVEYSTQLTEDKQNNFLLEMQDFKPFPAAVGLSAQSYYLAKRWAGDWSGTYSCGGVDGAADGPQGPYAMPATLVVAGQKAKLERVTRGGGVEQLAGEIGKPDGTTRLRLAGRGRNNPDDVWFTSFEGTITGKTYVADGEIKVDGRTMRGCHLELTQGGKAAAVPVSAMPTPAVPAAASTAAFVGTYKGVGEGNVVAEIREGSSGRYEVDLSTSTPTGCGGSVSGTASLEGKTLKFIGMQSGETCRAEISINGQGVQVEEGAGCNFFHGAACGFSGTLQRAK